MNKAVKAVKVKNKKLNKFFP